MNQSEHEPDRPRTVSVNLTEGHIDVLDGIARAENRTRSAQLRTLIDEEAARRAATSRTTAATAA